MLNYHGLVISLGFILLFACPCWCYSSVAVTFILMYHINATGSTPSVTILHVGAWTTTAACHDCFQFNGSCRLAGWIATFITYSSGHLDRCCLLCHFNTATLILNGLSLPVISHAYDSYAMDPPQLGCSFSELSLPQIFFMGVCYGAFFLISDSDTIAASANGHNHLISPPSLHGVEGCSFQVCYHLMTQLTESLVGIKPIDSCSDWYHVE